MTSWAIFASTLGFLLVAKPVQSTSITCLPAYSWMDNSLGQNPCLMATLAQDACGGLNVNILPLGSTPAEAHGFEYQGPLPASISTCMCSTVTYSLYQACGICQNGSSATWTQWISNCTDVTIGISTFPEPIPENSAFPAWAYLNVTAAGFNAAAAQADTAAPESTAIPTSTSTSSASATSSTSTSGPSAAGNPSTASHKSSNTGAIAGGVIGGLAFVAALAGLTFYLLRRQAQSHTVPSDTYYGAVPQKAAQDMSENSFAQQPQPVYRPYNPSDPSTFPESAPTPTVQTTSFPLAAQEQPGAYRGVAEV
ncbi:hypothetical protein FIBSPDRAFT_563014 [Athelia psychrophila]|uniref:Mid2 domain-containing protein n=1 Tax=Athelia psychrophila TaxID=1759441 RepID=A0A166I423_9AGAM|nr:hypothetical protein FIBSPDRAFT_563014 [Fibularhizoctonia sp. CBS 109695]